MNPDAIFKSDCVVVEVKSFIIAHVYCEMSSECGFS